MDTNTQGAVGTFANGAVTAALAYAVAAGVRAGGSSVTAAGSRSSKLDAVPEGEVVGTLDSDFRALELLDEIPLSARKEDGLVVQDDGSLVKSTKCSNHGCNFKVDLKDTDFVVHTHVKSRLSGKLGALETSMRNFPGPGDHQFPVRAGAPNYYRTPDGQIRVLEYYDNSWQVRTLRGVPLPNPSVWTPRQSIDNGRRR